MTERDFNKIPIHDQCPFLSRLILKEKKKLVKLADADKEKVYQLMEKDSNNNFTINNSIKIENLVLANEKTYEGSFIKVFKFGFINSLNNYALKIFVRITDILNLNNNKVNLQIESIMLHCKIDEPRKIYDGLNQLIELNIIARTKSKDYYYVNPAVMFRGSNRRILFTLNDY